MHTFLEQLNQRNPPLYYFGWLCLLMALACLALIPLTHTQVAGVNAWYKPFKFGLSIGLFAWTMGWYLHYLGPIRFINMYSWGVILLLGFELVYIALQAGRGQLSHYNLSSRVYTLLTGAMALAAVAATLGTAYVGVLFWQRDFPTLPTAYVWSIRVGLVLFVVFALLGGVMGANGSHTVGGLMAVQVCPSSSGAGGMVICGLLILWVCMPCKSYPCCRSIWLGIQWLRSSWACSMVSWPRYYSYRRCRENRFFNRRADCKRNDLPTGTQITTVFQLFVQEKDWRMPLGSTVKPTSTTAAYR